MRKILLPLILLASALPGCGPGLDTDSFHPGSIDGALFWYKAEQASWPSGGNQWSWTESLGNQTGLSLTGNGAPSIYSGSQGQKLMSLNSGSYFSMGYPTQPLSLGEFTVYAVTQGKTAVDGGIFGVLSNDLTSAYCASTNLSLRVTGSPAQFKGEFWNGSSSILASIPASTGLSVVELRYGSDGTLRLQAAGQSISVSAPYQTVSISIPKVALGAACLNSSQIATGNINLGEVLFYNRAVSDSESLRIRRYLMLRHGVSQ
jgi:hypothetical protein